MVHYYANEVQQSLQKNSHSGIESISDTPADHTCSTVRMAQYAEAVRLCTAAAELSHLPAQLTLARWLAEGRIVPQDTLRRRVSSLRRRAPGGTVPARRLVRSASGMWHQTTRKLPGGTQKPQQKDAHLHSWDWDTVT